MNQIAIVFDLDETIGYFSQLSVLWKVLNKIHFLTKKSELGQIQFNKIINHFKGILRPKIVEVFKFLLQNKEDNEKIILYTNNQVGKRWVILIKNYLEDILDSTLFDFLIYPYLIQGEIVDELRTTSTKTQNDLLRCTNMPNNTKICFIDDKYYPNLGESRQVHFIKLDPYIYKVPWQIMLEEIDKLEIVNESLINYTDLLNNKFLVNEEIIHYKDHNLLRKIIYFLKRRKNKTLRNKIYNQKSRKQHIKY